MCPDRGLFYFAGETFPDALAEVLQPFAENVAGFLSARRREEDSGPYAKANSRRKANGIVESVVLPAAYDFRGPVRKTVDPVSHAASNGRCGIVCLAQKVNPGSK